ncbi:endonuclease/exonuclease/phosphatase family protein [Paenibacillus allorhizosphaerae]|uniref:Endonuclease/exonuclease/phosphatase domain-containing protein n=1 Tax=Paenibacillus allorhizosphaerae TaxID=2849866 RepID=A0ABM8VD38_9BACL|nr:endonuclease/exonuclease/phosphatase family protein [Paenibacillus allorhizosphaerae]CAG7625080.1 hypothetical protein PAECIP111802_01129 [Paenibacillus allorhizosphaerae]
MTIQAMTLNLRYNEPKDGENAWPNRIDKVVSIIQANGPDVMGTQEGQYPMLVELQERLAGYRWIGKPRDDGARSEHCAVFYREERLEPLEEGHFWLSEAPEVPASKSWDTSITRICTWVRFRDKQTGESFAIFNTHLDHRGEEARRNGAALIYERMSAYRAKHGIPLLLMGDMNCTPDSDAIRFFRGELEIGAVTSDLQDVFDHVEKPLGKTFNGFKGQVEGEPIDYIFTTKDWAVTHAKIDRSQYDGSYPSDHYPVTATLETK